MSYQYAKFEENPCVGTDESTPLTRIYHYQFKLTSEIWTPGYKIFSMLNSTEHEFILPRNVKMPTVVGILTFIRRMNTTSESFKARKNL